MRVVNVRPMLPQFSSVAQAKQHRTEIYNYLERCRIFQVEKQGTAWAILANRPLSERILIAKETSLDELDRMLDCMKEAVRLCRAKENGQEDCPITVDYLPSPSVQ